ncbi:hypothetical protein EDB83DRAFT_2518383 [Lactarius deliciosus]|nr:hypothetical protein EDB83DRAFT_2518383 [Lactarius deliciosus]
MSTRNRSSRTPSPQKMFGSTRHPSSHAHGFPQRCPSSRPSNSNSNVSTDWRQPKNSARTAKIEPTSASDVLTALLATTSEEREAILAALFNEACKTRPMPPLTLARTPSPAHPLTNEEGDEFLTAARMLTDEGREELIDALLEYDDPCEEERWHALYTIRDRHRPNVHEGASPPPPPSRDIRALPQPATTETYHDSTDTRKIETTSASILPCTPSPVLPTTGAPEKQHTITKQEELLQTLLADDYAEDAVLERALSDLAPDNGPTEDVEEWLNSLIYSNNYDPAAPIQGVATQTAYLETIAFPPVPPRSDSERLENSGNVEGDDELSTSDDDSAGGGLPGELTRLDPRTALLKPALNHSPRHEDLRQRPPQRKLVTDAVPTMNPGYGAARKTCGFTVEKLRGNLQTSPEPQHYHLLSREDALPSPDPSYGPSTTLLSDRLNATSDESGGIRDTPIEIPPIREPTGDTHNDAATSAWSAYAAGRDASAAQRKLTTMRATRLHNTTPPSPAGHAETIRNDDRSSPAAHPANTPQVEAPADEPAGGDALSPFTPLRNPARAMLIAAPPTAPSQAHACHASKPVPSDPPSPPPASPSPPVTFPYASRHGQLPRWSSFRANFVTAWESHACASNDPKTSRALSVEASEGHNTPVDSLAPCSPHPDASLMVVEDHCFRGGVNSLSRLLRQRIQHNKTIRLSSPDTSAAPLSNSTPLHTIFPRYTLELSHDPDELATRNEPLQEPRRFRPYDPEAVRTHTSRAGEQLCGCSNPAHEKRHCHHNKRCKLCNSPGHAPFERLFPHSNCQATQRCRVGTEHAHVNDNDECPWTKTVDLEATSRITVSPSLPTTLVSTKLPTLSLTPTGLITTIHAATLRLLRTRSAAYLFLYYVVSRSRVLLPMTHFLYFFGFYLAPTA